MSAVEQVLESLGDAQAGSSLRLTGGYVDVLGNDDAVGPHRGQQVFRKALLARVYERIWRPLVSRFFFGLRGPRAREERRIAVEMLELERDDRVLDVGCGPGNYTRHLAAACRDGLVVGLDASAPMVATASKRDERRNLAYVRGDACALPFGDGEFDAVCCVGVIHMLERPMAALDEMIRVLAPAGRLVIVASCGPPGASRRVRGGVTRFGRDELTAAIAGHGLRDVRQRIVRRGQFVSARKPAEASDGG